MTKHIGVIGHGFVGRAVQFGFDTDNTDVRIADPRYSTSARNLFLQHAYDPEVVFICVPTPMASDGSIDASILLEVCEELRDHGNGCVAVIKSTVTPDKLRECINVYENLVYSPEFLREATAEHDFVNPDMHVFGCDKFEPASAVVELYNNYSKCEPCPYFLVKPEVASLVKYTINSFLATKVTFFNELYDVFTRMGIPDYYESLTEILSFDPRMGSSHMQVPGPDGRRGFGGACFAKDTAAFSKFSQSLDADFMLLNEAIKINSHYRGQYDELDEREKEQNVQYGLTGT
jgi:UDPglucose 6-dehydrogenase